MAIAPYATWQQSHWIELSRDFNLPAWQRVSFYAYGHHGQHGHCPVAPGLLEGEIGVIDRKTWEIRPRDPSNLNKAIAAAIERGWLSPGSSRRCLIVPVHAVRGGAWGRPGSECRHHKRMTSSKPGHSVTKTPA